MKRYFLITAAAALLVGCATTMTDRASRVQIITPEQAENYIFIAHVSSSSSLTGVMRHTGYQNALNDVLDKAASMGADAVVLDARSGPSYFTTSEVVRAQAYRKK